MSDPKAHYFLAVPLPNPVRELLRRQAEALSDKLPYKQWPHPQDYHITLAFLGEAGFRTINELKQTVAPAVEECDPFTVTLNGLGTFGKKEQPRVLWAGVSADQGLYDLQNEVDKVCRSVGFELDKRPYKPHITLAKKWTGKETLNRKELEVDLETASWQVDNIVLYQIHLRRVPKYQPLKFFTLHRGSEV
ncbi:MAG TPA: RNA 2',3'-cyclic phosphodiesterase [Bacillales bacterium]